MTRFRLLLLSAVLALSACATMSPDECRVADWYLIGEMDARAGHSPAHFANRDRACREAGYPADQQSWREGWEQGLTVFCTDQMGFRFGRDGGRYERICPAALEPGFLSGFDIGREIHALSQRTGTLSGEISTLDGKIREGRRSGSLERDELDKLQRERSALQRRLREAELELAELNGVARGRGLL